MSNNKMYEDEVVSHAIIEYGFDMDINASSDFGKLLTLVLSKCSVDEQRQVIELLHSIKHKDAQKRRGVPWLTGGCYATPNPTWYKFINIMIYFIIFFYRYGGLASCSIFQAPQRISPSGKQTCLWYTRQE
jgi:hypothetical protein